MSEPFYYKATLVRVIDGDTIDVDIDLGFSVWLNKQRVRLAGIDTPESRNPKQRRKGTWSSGKGTIEGTLR